MTCGFVFGLGFVFCVCLGFFLFVVCLFLT